MTGSFLPVGSIFVFVSEKMNSKFAEMQDSLTVFFVLILHLQHYLCLHFC